MGEFSRRREEILDGATQLGVKSPEGLREITKRSRDPKRDVEDREALKQSWVDRAVALGFDGKGLVAAAVARAGIAQPDSALERGYCAIVEAIDGARYRVGALLRPRDPLVANALARRVKPPAEPRNQSAYA